ncbi:MAG: hypothetical protein ACFBRM_07430, partial [Pikeienuella sp.]
NDNAIDNDDEVFFLDSSDFADVSALDFDLDGDGDGDGVDISAPILTDQLGLGQAAAIVGNMAGDRLEDGDLLDFTGVVGAGAPVFDFGADDIASGGDPATALVNGDAGVTYGLGGPDASAFALSADMGLLSIAAAAPVSVDGDQLYDLSVSVTDADGLAATVAVTVDLG